jgi:flagellar motility protein MotE (MotC chaperone)
MKKRRFEFRLIPVVVLAGLGLFALKALGIVFDGGYTLGERLSDRNNQITVTSVPPASTQLRYETTPMLVASTQAQQAKVSWMRQMFYPDSNGATNTASADNSIITGSVHGAPPPAEPPKEGAKAEAPATKPAEPPAAAPPEPPKQVSAAERAILEKLQERRQELDARSRELEMRENMLKTEEQKLDQRDPGANKDTDARGNAAAKKDDIEQARFKGLITMYETMKPKDAAKIFDRLDMKVLLDMASQIKPQRMSEILALMSAEAAERLTVEMATRGSDKSNNPNDLPKIDGKPGGM